MSTKEVDNISVNQLLAVIWRRKLSVVLPTLLLAGAFTAYAYHLPERYEAQALIVVDPQANAANVQIRQGEVLGSSGAGLHGRTAPASHYLDSDNDG